uniref:Uncharacterized protein n=1 Tax=Gasterosteus aculeatus TaxID=69293 RepID=G3PM87_GASAC
MEKDTWQTVGGLCIHLISSNHTTCPSLGFSAPPSPGQKTASHTARKEVELTNDKVTKHERAGTRDV